MIKYLAKVLGFWDRFERVVVTQIPRTENERADALARLGSATDEKDFGLETPGNHSGQAFCE